jgi:Tol biopolymer transport system component
MYVVGRDGRAPRPVEHEFLTGLRPMSAEWHPDGRVSVWGQTESDTPAFVTVPVDRGRASRSVIAPDVRGQLVRTGLTLSNFTWAPDGRHLYFEGRSQLVRNIWRVTVDPDTLAWIDGPDRLTTGPGTDAGLAISPDGRRLAFGASSGRVGLRSFEFDPASGKLVGPGELVTRSGAEDTALDASRDGRKLVFRTLRNDRQELWEQSPESGARLLVSTSEWSHSPPRWSPDGTRVAYQRSRKDLRGPKAERAVSILVVQDRHEELLTAPGDATIIPADWSDDGASILAACRLSPAERMGTCRLSTSRDGNERLARLSLDNRLDMLQQRFSPDQRWISFIGVPSGDRSLSAVYVMPAAGGPWTAVSDGDWYDDKPRWAPDGRTIYFISNRDGRPEVWGRGFDQATGQPSGSPFRVTNFQGSRQVLSPYMSQMDMVITARRIFLPIYEASGQVWILEDVDK